MTKHGALKPLASAIAHAQAGQFAPGVPRDKAPTGSVPVAQLAQFAGDRADVTPPMDNTARATSYRGQRGNGTFCAQLTPAQSRRLRKKGRAQRAAELAQLSLYATRPEVIG